MDCVLCTGVLVYWCTGVMCTVYCMLCTMQCALCLLYCVLWTLCARCSFCALLICFPGVPACNLDCVLRKRKSLCTVSYWVLFALCSLQTRVVELLSVCTAPCTVQCPWSYSCCVYVLHRVLCGVGGKTVSVCTQSIRTAVASMYCTVYCAEYGCKTAKYLYFLPCACTVQIKVVQLLHLCSAPCTVQSQVVKLPNLCTLFAPRIVFCVLYTCVLRAEHCAKGAL